MLIDKVINELVSKKVHIQTKLGYEADFVVYMRRDFYRDCKQELKGELQPDHFEFWSGSTVWGYDICLASCIDNEKHHPDYRICEVNND